MFDKVTINVIGGKGGDGAINMRREKFVPYGGADGGDGGDGGDVVIRTNPSVSNYHFLVNKGQYKAPDGGYGLGKKMHGKRGDDRIIDVPVGTIVYDAEDGKVLGDLREEGSSIVVANGGKGGYGNVRYASPINQTPRLAQVGEQGEIKTLNLELRLIADAGIIGFPNVGKSSLLAAASAAKPEIADYPFTTREPELGVVEVDRQIFVLAEIPGLIEGAAQGKGLGHDFLRHSTRTRVIIHLVDGSSASPVEDMIKVNNELALFDTALMQKPQIVAVNKIDLPEVKKRVKELTRDFKVVGIVPHFISAGTGEGVPELMRATLELLKANEVISEPQPMKIFRPLPAHQRLAVAKEGDVFVVRSSEIERVAARVDLEEPNVRAQLRGLLIRKGLGRLLENAGIKGGDTVRCGNAEFEW